MKRMNKGFTMLLPLAIGLITLAAGVTLLYLLPEYILGAISASGIANTGACYAYNTSPTECSSSVATCCVTYQTYQNATTNIGVIRGIGMAVIVISLIWIIIAVIAGRKEGM